MNVPRFELDLVGPGCRDLHFVFLDSIQWDVLLENDIRKELHKRFSFTPSKGDKTIYAMANTVLNMLNQFVDCKYLRKGLMEKVWYYESPIGERQ